MRKTFRMAPVELAPGAWLQPSWCAMAESDLLDVRLEQVEGDMAIGFVMLGVDICAAWATKRRRVQPGQYVTVELRNTGRVGGRCTVVLDVDERPEEDKPTPWAVRRDP